MFDSGNTCHQEGMLVSLALGLLVGPGGFSPGALPASSGCFQPFMGAHMQPWAVEAEEERKIQEKKEVQQMAVLCSCG